MTLDISTFADEKLKTDHATVTKSLARVEKAIASGQTYVPNTSTTLGKLRIDMLKIINIIEAEQERRKEEL